MTAAIRILAYGMLADAIDEYVQIVKSTEILSLKHFCQSVINIFEAEYLRVPRPDDIARLLTIGKAQGFQYAGKLRLHALEVEELSDSMARAAPPAIYSINGHTYNMGYYLIDGIYPPWTTLVQTISYPDGPKQQHFADMQEAARKDVEQAFRVLQARFAFVRGPAPSWDFETLGKIMKTCIILHNMIMEDEREGYPSFEYETSGHNPLIVVLRDFVDDFESFVSRHIRIRDVSTHYAIRNDLIEHLWQPYGDS